MSKERDDFVAAKIAKMSLLEKCGQLLTFTWRGAIPTPSGIEQITKLHAGGICLEPYALETCKNLYWGRSQVDPNFKKPDDYFDIAHTWFNSRAFGISVTPEELTEALNNMQKIAMNRPSGIPLHVTIDMEGDFKNDYTAGGVLQFIPPMGITAIGDVDLAYKIANLMGRQMAAIGVTQFYHPVCDVNINPLNPEIGVRSFGDNVSVISKFIDATVRGYEDAGITATIKHFAGRGDSATDAHDVLDVCRGDKKRMQDVELAAFQAGVDAGASALMTAHTIFPAYDEEYPATLSKKILTDLLRGEMGFDGIIVSDAIGMAAILKKWPLPLACAMAIKAGVDTILLKADDESRSQCLFGIKSAVENGTLPEERVNDAVRRLLCRKYDQGLFEKAGKMDPKETTKIVRSKENRDFSREVAHKALLVVRDDKKLLPLSKDKKILVIEQTIPYEFLGKDLYSHAHMFCEQMVKHSTNLILDDAPFHAEEEDIEEALRLAKEADLVVMTNYYARIEKRGNNTHLARALKAAGHTVVVVTNFPYRKGTTTVADAVVCNFSGTPDSIRASADLLFGAIKPYPTTKMPIDLSAEQNLPEEPDPAPRKSQEKKPGNVWGGKC
ncbi:MAG TPA: glycoside hydrolase family 3 N-terminal domain-containing protein [Bacteroidales bacterium]|jgi:beta-N-acetylhexosaminidase|nr:glycoside hydrolase family 3 N-terminal domain-containing protein [Bacteroidales bacterium]NLD64351.1 glycoside hydrolase family 3 protein [Bacteroidales bacterium]HNX82985.1 glycoside hydrolase family 3 N-terminal domain-containing protein [Bacteroidales bacterium]